MADKTKCMGITKKGCRCKRSVKKGKGKYCFQHKKKKSKKKEECTICTNPEVCKKLECCGNMIGEECLKKWKKKSLNNNCPFCRKTFGGTQPPRPRPPVYYGTSINMSGPFEIDFLDDETFEIMIRDNNGILTDILAFTP